MKQLLEDALAILESKADDIVIDRFSVEIARRCDRGERWGIGLVDAIVTEGRLRNAVNLALLHAERDKCYAEAQAILDGTAGHEGGDDA